MTSMPTSKIGGRGVGRGGGAWATANRGTSTRTAATTRDLMRSGTDRGDADLDSRPGDLDLQLALLQVGNRGVGQPVGSLQGLGHPRERRPDAHGRYRELLEPARSTGDAVEDVIVVQPRHALVGAGRG